MRITNKLSKKTSLTATAPANIIEQIDSLNERGYEIKKSDTQRSLKLVIQACRLAETNSYERGRAFSLLTSSHCYFLMGDYKTGLVEAIEAAGLFEALGDKLKMAEALNYLGMAYIGLGDYVKAIESLSKSLVICDKLDDKSGTARSLLNMGFAFSHLGDYAKGLDFFQQCLRINVELNRLEGVAKTLLNIGVIHEKLGEYEQATVKYIEAAKKSRAVKDPETESIALANLGEMYTLRGDYANSIKYQLKALDVSRKNKNKFLKGITQINLGKLYEVTEEYEKAFDYYNKGLKTLRSTGSRQWESEALLRLGELLYKQQKYARAIAAFSEALVIAEEIGSSEYIFKAHHFLSRIYEEQGDFAQALKHYKEFFEFRQKVFGEEAEKNLNRVIAQAEIEKAQQEAEIHRLRLVELAVLIKELETSLTLSKLEALKAQLHPHFLFNSLHSVTALVLKNENKNAVRMINRLSELLRLTLSQDDSSTIKLSQEINFIKKYLEIEEIRFHDRLSVSFDIAPETLRIKVPPMILQPVVENAIRHAIASHSSASRIEISAFIKNNKLCIEVCDDGPGLTANGIRQSAGKGFGLENTRKRLAQMYKENFTLDLRNGPEKGAVAAFCLPLEIDGKIISA